MRSNIRPQGIFILNLLWFFLVKVSIIDSVYLCRNNLVFSIVPGALIIFILCISILIIKLSYAFCFLQVYQCIKLGFYWVSSFWLNKIVIYS